MKLASFGARSLKAMALCLLVAFAGPGCNRCSPDPAPPVEPNLKPSESAQVSVVPDGERIGRARGVTPSMRGEGNPIWRPGQPITLFGLSGEVLAFQVVVSAGAEALTDVRVEFSALAGPEPLAAERFQRFVVYELPFPRRSGGKVPGESLGWEKQATPAAPAPGTSIPDPLIPVEIAPSWAPYPLKIEASSQQAIWVDLDLASRTVPRGNYTGSVRALSGSQVLAEIPLRLQVGAPELPYAAVSSMLYFEPERVTERIGSAKAVSQYLQLMHQHHISSVLPVRNLADISSVAGLFDGKLFTAEQGYQGAGAGVGTSVVALGAYGTLGDPTPEQLSLVSKLLRELERLGVTDQPGARDVFLYAVDEQCESPRGKLWRAALDASADAALRGLRVGHTCSDPPETQAVDLVIMFSSEYSLAAQASAKRLGKRLWIYNGTLPQTGSFLTDSPLLSLRANAWIQARYGVERWFYWESTFWHDGNKGGLGPYDPFATSETFHNQHADHANGDGVLVYPGRQVASGSTQAFAHDLGFDGVVPSLRLKQWRRGIQDAGYIQLARKVDPAATLAVLSERIPEALVEVRGRPEPRWGTQAAGWEEARRKLFDILERQGSTAPASPN